MTFLVGFIHRMTSSKAKGKKGKKTKEESLIKPISKLSVNFALQSIKF